MELLPPRLASNLIVISLNYRLAPAYPYPAQIRDMKRAVRCLRAKAATLGLDPARLGALGTSAGAHLAAMLGLTDAGAGWDTGPYLEQSSQVAAVVDFFGPVDLTQTFPGLTSAISDGVFGTLSPEAGLPLEASLVTYVNAGDPPYLLIHGAQDDFVPPSQSEILRDGLIRAGVPVELVLVQGGRHAFINAAYPVEPSREDLMEMVAAFFVERLP